MRKKINEHQYIAPKVELNSEVTKKASNMLSIISMDYSTGKTWAGLYRSAPVPYPEIMDK